MTDSRHAERIDLYLYGLLSPNEAQQLERAIETSPEWREAFDAGKRRHRELIALPPVEASEGLIQQALQTIERRVARRRSRLRTFFRTLVFTSTVCAAALFGVHRHYATMAPTPFDLKAFGQNQLHAGSNGALRLALHRIDDGRPLPGAQVRMALFDPGRGEEIRLADFQTDGDGAAAPRFTMPDWSSGVYTLRITAKTDAGDETIERPITLKRESKLMLSSDKPLYQPGQTIELRALALRRPDLKPVEAQPAVFTITDPQGNVIFKRSGVTSRFGIASARCPLATEIAQGAYEVRCRVGDTESQLTVNIEKYVLPKFRTTLTLDKPYYRPGDVVKGKVDVEYFFGRKVTSGQVEVTVQTTDVEVDTLEQSLIEINTEGKVEFECQLPEQFVGRETTNGDATIQIVAKATDSAGQTQSAALSRVVTAHPLRLDVISESGALVKNVPNRLFVLASYADGRPATATIAVNSEKPVETNAMGVASFELTPASDKIGLTIAAKDSEGITGQKHLELVVGSTQDDFLFHTDKAVYQGGETLHATILGGGSHPLFLDVLKDRQTLLTRTIEMKDGRGELDLDLPSDAFGTLQLYAYRLSVAGIPVMKTRTIYVEHPSQLKITVARNQEEYRPGEEATLKFHLTDADGKPTPGALSLAAVDEAVFHVLKQRPGLEGLFFQLEEELLAPVYAISPWSPFSQELPGQDGQASVRDEWERALFSRTSRSVQPVFLRGSGGGGAADGAPRRDFGMVDAGDPETREAIPAPIFDVAGNEMSGQEVNDDVPVSSPLTLAESSYPEKADRLRARRAIGLRRVSQATFAAIGLFAVALLGGFAAFRPRAFLISAGVTAALAVLGVGTLVALSIASPKLAREVARAVPEAARDFAEAAGVDLFRAEPPMAMAMEGMGGIGLAGGDAGEAAAPIRVRKAFPETLLWLPQLVTDDQGEAILRLPLADSITNWRLTASAVSAQGKLGALQDGIRVFQPFFVDLNLPVALTRNDEVAIPIVVYNYLSEPQTVEITLERDEWFELIDAESPEEAAIAETPEPLGKAEEPDGDASPAKRTVDLQPNEIRSTASASVPGKWAGTRFRPPPARNRCRRSPTPCDVRSSWNRTGRRSNKSSTDRSPNR